MDVDYGFERLARKPICEIVPRVTYQNSLFPFRVVQLIVDWSCSLFEKPYREQKGTKNLTKKGSPLFLYGEELLFRFLRDESVSGGREDRIE